MRECESEEREGARGRGRGGSEGEGGGEREERRREKVDHHLIINHVAIKTGVVANKAQGKQRRW